MAPTTNKESLEPELKTAGFDMRGTQLGDFAVGFETWPAGDYRDLFEGLERGCEATHYGYVLKGRARITYHDGTSEEAKAGDVYFARPGHRIEVLEDATVVEFTPADGVYEETMKVIEKNLPRFLEKFQAAEA